MCLCIFDISADVYKEIEPEFQQVDSEQHSACRFNERWFA